MEELTLPQNLVSYHLSTLRQAGLVRLHRSDADGRATYYGLDMAAVTSLYRRLGDDLALPLAPHPETLPPLTVVFLCRANSARSQIAEGWLRSLSGGRVTVRSAGTQPARLHPLAEQAMAEVGIDIGHQQSKHVDALAQLAPDVVVTVCDIAREECAVWQRAGTRITGARRTRCAPRLGRSRSTPSALCAMNCASELSAWSSCCRACAHSPALEGWPRAAGA